MKARLVVAAIEMAVARRGGDVAGCILHSDRGSQFRARKVHRALARHGMVGSMGQVGSAGDNAAMESFFALLQKNVLDRRRWATRDELRIAIVTWIERTYHRRRRQAALGRLTPIEYETIMTPHGHPGRLTQPVTKVDQRPMCYAGRSPLHVGRFALAASDREGARMACPSGTDVARRPPACKPCSRGGVIGSDLAPKSVREGLRRPSGAPCYGSSLAPGGRQPVQ